MIDPLDICSLAEKGAYKIVASAVLRGPEGGVKGVSNPLIVGVKTTPPMESPFSRGWGSGTSGGPSP